MMNEMKRNTDSNKYTLLGIVIVIMMMFLIDMSSE